MFEALIEYAKQNQLVTEPGFGTKKLHWLIQVSRTGQFQGVKYADEKNRRAKQFLCCPELQQPDLVAMPKSLQQWSIDVSQPAHFLIDSCQRVILYPQSDQCDQKTLEHHKTFVALIKLASEAVKILQPIAQLLSSQSQLELIRRELQKLNASGSDKISFAINEVAVLEETSWHDWWRDFIKQTFPRSQTREMISLVSGEVIAPSLTHPKIASLTDEISFGASIVAVNKSAFESFGLVQAEHAAMSVGSAAAYRAALEHMLGKTRLFLGMKTIYWYDRPVPDQLDPLALLFKRDYAHDADYRLHLEEILYKINTLATLEKDQPRENKCHIMVLREHQNRAKVMMYYNQPIQNVISALLTWLDDTAFLGIGAEKPIVDLPYEFRSIFNEKPSKNQKKESKNQKKPADKDTERTDDFQPLLVMLYQAVLNPNLPIPKTLVSHSLKAIFSSMIKREMQIVIDKKTSSSMRLGNVLYARLGILKAFFYRSRDRYLQQQLNPKHPSAHYQAGRLTAFLAFISRIHDSQNAQFNRHRLFLQAVKTPMTTLQIQIEVSQQKLRKLEKTRPWLRTYLLGELDQIWEMLRGRIPPNTSIEHHSLFTLGFYQQYLFDLKRSNLNEFGIENTPQIDLIESPKETYETH